MICQNCGVEAPTKYVAFHQNIGALLVRFSKSIEGELCKSCIHRYFWAFSLTSLFLGWWGTISFFVTPFFLLNNIGRYIGSLTMKPVPPGATEPQLTEEVIEKLQPYTVELIRRLNEGGKFQEVAEDIAHLAGVTPGQIVCYVRALVESRKQNQP
jgi:hypothetical protein